MTLSYRRTCCLPLVLMCALCSVRAFAQSSTRPSSLTATGPSVATDQSDQSQVTTTLSAEPKPQGANPFQPSANRDVRLPVTLKGFCIVTLRERQEWLLGSESHQVVFDGQLYWFAGQRQRAMFAATPQRYVPALAGNCVVTFAEHGVRKCGGPQYGILHDQRLFFFRSLAEQKQFQSNPDDYANLDLANKGRCLVSEIEEQRQLPGLPETTLIVDGLRYRFVGVHQQRKFLANMRHYGVAMPTTLSTIETPEVHAKNLSPSQFPDGLSDRNKRTKNKTPSKTSVATLTNKAMGGYCPVSIHEQGIWVLGENRIRAKFDGLTYLLAGESEQEQFVKNPNRYVPALGGHCVVTEIDNNQRVPGSIYHASQYEDRLFLFAGAEQKKAFKASPATYFDTDLAVEGNCIVTLVDEGKKIAGLPELLVWHQGKRYLFASTEQQAKFRENLQRYQDR